MLLDDNPLQRSHLIAGSTSGKPVYITPQAKPIYDELYKLAKRNNYWAQVTVKGIQDLAAGRLHMNNIFVHPGSARRDGKEEFVVVLPGCKVTAEKLDGDGYKLLYFEADANYFNLEAVDTKPDVFEVTRKLGDWSARATNKGLISKTDDRIVTVTDRSYRDVDEAAATSAVVASSTPFHGGAYVERLGFDMHFTPGEQSLGGLKNYRRAIRPISNESVNESALILARAMHAARNQKGIVWASERGGATVLTQALKIYADQGGNLKHHHLFMAEPTVSTSEAVKQAHLLGMKLDRDVVKVGFLNFMGNSGQMATIAARFKGEADYTLLKAGSDAVKQGMSIQGGVAALGTLGGLALAAGGVSIGSPAIPALLTYMAAVAGGTIGAVAAAGAVTEQVAPKLYHKMKGKF